MATSDTPRRHASYEHIVERGQNGETGLRLGLLAATTIHIAVFAITWPTLAGPQPAPVPPRPHDYAFLQPVHFQPSRPIIEIPKLTGRSIPAPGPERQDPEPIVEREIEFPGSKEPPKVVLVIPEPPPTITTAPEVVEAYVDVNPPTVIHRIKPRYTAAARRLGIEGVVVVSLLIDKDGRVVDLTVLRRLPFGLTENAVEAVRQWLFEPCAFNGKPVSVRYSLTINYRLESRN